MGLPVIKIKENARVKFISMSGGDFLNVTLVFSDRIILSS